MKKIILLIVIILAIAVVIFAGYLIFNTLRSEPIVVGNFEECVKAGYPVTDIAPFKCETPDGNIFIEEKKNDVLIKVFEPQNGQTIKNPVVIKGEARGYWYFEASFPIKLIDANGEVLAIAPAQAQGEWMTENFVPFELVLPFKNSNTKTGMIILQKDNPSGLPENDAQIEIPVIFKDVATSTKDAI